MSSLFEKVGIDLGIVVLLLIVLVIILMIMTVSMSLRLTRLNQKYKLTVCQNITKSIRLISVF